MPELLGTIPNRLSAARLVLLPLMWALALLRLPFYVGIGIFISFLTDVLDGHLARRLNQVSESGGKLDSLADNLLTCSALIWLWLLRADVYTENPLLCWIAIAIYLASLLLGALKFKRFGNLHLYSSKAAGVVSYLFLSSALIMNHYSPLLFRLAAAIFIISSSETLLLQLVSTRVDEHMGSIAFVLRRRYPG